MPEPSAPLAAAVPEKVVIVLAAGLGAGQAANAAACLAAGLVARQPNWAGQALRDADGMLSSAISHLPIIVLTADEARMAQLRERLSLPMPGDAGMTLFRPMRARSTRPPNTGPGIARLRIATSPCWAWAWPARGAGSMP